MRFFRDWSIKWKLTVIVLVTSATPLLLSSVAFVVYEIITFKRWMVREISTQADIIGSNNKGNLSFYSLGIDTKDDAETTLQTLQVNPYIISACIYSQDNKILATYHRGETQERFPSEPLTDTHRFGEEYLTLFKSIIQDDEKIGTVYIKSDLQELSARLQQYIGIVALFMLGSFVVAFVLSTILQRFISNPILQLAQTAKVVSEQKDYSIRAEKGGRDEVGRLIDDFNGMLAKIQKRDRELEDYSRNLEDKVEARTHELTEKNLELDKTLKQLKQTQDQVILQEKMASLGALTAGIAHEIQNPLNFVNNFADLSVELTHELREDLENHKQALDTETLKKCEETLINADEILADLEQNAQKINEHGKRADSIVKSMLLHSRGKSGERIKSDLNHILDEALNLTYHGMRARDSSFNVSIDKHYDESIGEQLVVPQDLSRAFLNLINNAFYATNEKAKSTADGYSPKLLVRTKNLGDKIEITIRDNGNGIPKDVAEKIFNPFYTTKPAGEGTGLGLSMSYDIVVQKHKGELYFKSEEGSFTEFIVTLPNNKK